MPTRSDDVQYVVTIASPDRSGLVHAVTGLLVQYDGNIVESQQYHDLAADRFFMRVAFQIPADGATMEELRAAFAAIATPFEMTWNLWDAGAPYRTLVMVSTGGHCLNDLLFRWSRGALQIDLAVVVSNHTVLEPLTRSYDLDFHHIPVSAENKSAAEAQLMGLVDSLDIDLVVLARYMQVFTNETSRALSGKAINIHHSFLPSFKGARPYGQAFDRGSSWWAPQPTT